MRTRVRDEPEVLSLQLIIVVGNMQMIVVIINMQACVAKSKGWAWASFLLESTEVSSTYAARETRTRGQDFSNNVTNIAAAMATPQ